MQVIINELLLRAKKAEEMMKATSGEIGHQTNPFELFSLEELRELFVHYAGTAQDLQFKDDWVTATQYSKYAALMQVLMAKVEGELAEMRRVEEEKFNATWGTAATEETPRPSEGLAEGEDGQVGQTGQVSLVQ